MIVLFGDSHLDVHKWADRPDLRGDSFCSYSQIVDYAVAKKASAVIAAGDFLDIRLPGSRVIGFVREKLELLQKANCQQYFILGQHDYADPPWPSAVSDNAIHMDRKLVALEGMQFYGLDWRRAEELTDALNGIPKEARILIAHQVWSEFMGVGRSEGSWEQIPRHIHTLFTGDFHETHVIKTSYGLRVISPGSTNLRRVNERQEKYFFTLTRDGNKVRWRRHRLKTRRRLNKTILTHSDLESYKYSIKRTLANLADALKEKGYPEEIRKPILYVKYDAELECAAEIVNAAADMAHVFEIAVRLNKSTNETEDRLQFREDLVRKGADAVLERITNFPDELKHLARRLLLAGPQYSAELLAIRRENGLEDVTQDALKIAPKQGSAARLQRNTVIAEHSRRYRQLEESDSLYLLDDESMKDYCSRRRIFRKTRNKKVNQDEEDSGI